MPPLWLTNSQERSANSHAELWPVRTIIQAADHGAPAVTPLRSASGFGFGGLGFELGGGFGGSGGVNLVHGEMVRALLFSAFPGFLEPVGGVTVLMLTISPVLISRDDTLGTRVLHFPLTSRFPQPPLVAT